MKPNLLITLILLVAVNKTLLAQKIINKIAFDSTKAALVIVTVVNDANQPRAKEEIIFKAMKANKTYHFFTNKEGVLQTALPAGDDYSVALKSFVDSTDKGTFSIPALEKGAYYSKPMNIHSAYEPPQSFTLKHVEFDVNKSSLRPVSFKELNDLAAYLSRHTEVNIEVQGHTDNVGKDQDNLTLSKARALAVKAYLVKKGVLSNHIQTKGFGATVPIADNETEAGRQANRRTEIIVLEQ